MGAQRGTAQADPRGQRWNVIQPSQVWITELLPAPPRINLVAARRAPQVPIKPQPHRGKRKCSTAFVKAGAFARRCSVLYHWRDDGIPSCGPRLRSKPSLKSRALRVDKALA